MGYTRRKVFQWGVASSIAIPSLGGLVARASTKRGDLIPTVDANTGASLIKLPEGFSYETMSWESTRMADGSLIPKRHDGMAVVPGASENEYVLLRNHENWFDDKPFGGDGVPIYDSASNTIEMDEGAGKVPVTLAPSGGVTGLIFKDGVYQETVPLLTGTMVNCAGGPTPWGTWLTCEELVVRGDRVKGFPEALHDHGYVFEVPPPHLGNASAIPIKDMGLFRHEAVAIDPLTGYGYLTEDNGPNSGLYRFIPSDNSQQVGSLEKGGKLQMLKVRGESNTDLRDVRRGDSFELEWIPIENPDSDPDGVERVSLSNMFVGKSGPYMEGEKKGGARFSRLEGCWHHDGIIYFVDTDSGPAGAGTLWILDTKIDKITVMFTSTGEMQADAIDNVGVNDRTGLIVVCEDGGGIRSEEDDSFIGSRMLVIKPDGSAVAFAENNLNLESLNESIPAELGDYRSSEWAGATFSPDGQTLYANIQTPGVTFAITGPWSDL
ncbi:MAG: DUF839 domain-containing protein [Gammaproteobacteria bacterium]|nr:DUF839 domain-containing protein [Gammaproteobacteria bacterium]